MSEPKYNGITAAVKAQARQARRDAKAAVTAARAPKAPQYSPNVVNRRSDTLARIIAKYRTQGVKFSSSSVQICRRRSLREVDYVGVSVKKQDGKTHASLCNVFMCRNSIHCPYCKGYREAHTRDYLTECVSEKAKAKRLSAGLLTFTHRHAAATDPNDLTAYVPQANAFYGALSHYHSNAFRVFNALGGGYITGVESPMGANGLHLHAHEIVFFDASLSKDERNRLIEKLKTIFLASLKRFGLSASSSCIDFKENFDIGYIAKSGTNEIEASDNAETIRRKRADYELTREKTNHGHSNNREFVEYLDDAKHDKAAEIEVVRHLLAMGGRDRWIVSRRLTKMLGIPSLSEYKAKRGEAQADAPEKKMVAEIHPEAFNIANELINQRPAIALILRAGKNEEARPGSVSRMVKALIDATMQAHEARITAKIQRNTDAKIAKLKEESASIGRHESITATFVRALEAQGKKEAKDACNDYRLSVRKRLTAKQDKLDDLEMRNRVASANMVGMDFINNQWIKIPLVSIPSEVLNTMYESFGKDLVF